MKTNITYILVLILLFAPSEMRGQEAPDTTFDLSLLATGETWAVFNRAVTVAEEGQKRGRSGASISTRNQGQELPGFLPLRLVMG